MEFRTELEMDLEARCKRYRETLHNIATTGIIESEKAAEMMRRAAERALEEIEE